MARFYENFDICFKSDESIFTSLVIAHLSRRQLISRCHHLSPIQIMTSRFQTESEQAYSISAKSQGRNDVENNFEKAKAHKSTIEAAISEFNCHPVKGIEFLKSNCLVKNTPVSVAQFLINTSSNDIVLTSITTW
ncbi:hypothetical protein L6452_36213 [Arctium lappa]|uniref:Uncharacterized protein n=1 Tax=Arctium lappa TaxID=4217 RepID=A0ACB8Y9W8_ARCLA|nr:hypothetical protein L6452_36213 [Arctium lappa]